MSANQSHLSDPHYGYDFVVATTQGSINATMKNYLYNTSFTPVQMYWNQDDNGNPVAVDREDLLKQTNGTDPLLVPNWQSTDAITPDITNLNNSNFYFAFEASLGIPANMAPDAIPDIVTLQEGTQAVAYTMLCATFTVVTCTFGRHGLASFESYSQPTDTPWEIQATIPLKSVVDNTNPNLPATVKARLDALGPDAFSVQHLLFDLDNAILQSMPTIGNLAPGTPAYTLLSQVFLGAYFAQMKAQGTPALNYSVVQNTQATNTSTLTLTNMTLEASPFTPAAGGQPNPNLNTLNYLCAAGGDALPPATPFAWNWVEAAEAASFDGVIAINRTEFFNYLNVICSASLGDLNIVPSVSMTHHDLDMSSSWGFQQGSGTGQAFTVLPAGQASVDGFTPVLSYSLANNSSDNTENSAHSFAMNGSFIYTATVNISVSGDTMRMQTHLVVYVYFCYSTGGGDEMASFSNNVIDFTNSLDYTISVQQDGSLAVSASPANFQDNSKPLDLSTWDKIVEGFIGNISGTMTDITNKLKPVAQNAMTSFDQDIANSLNGYRDWVFPGGNAFAFKDIVFSDSQDLVSHITYVQPV